MGNDTVTQRIARVREAIDGATRRRGDGPAVELIAISKRHPPEAIRAAAAAGLRDFGENYAQEMRDKMTALQDLDLRWHYVGPLQSNKVKYVVGKALVHTVDRPNILDALQKRAASQQVDQAVLIQVNIAREPQKSGVDPDNLEMLLDHFAGCDRVHCRGLMLIPPAGSPEQTRPHFRALRLLRDRLASRARARVELAHLSMGMSSDFAMAIEEGATLIRVGTALFGPRPT